MFFDAPEELPEGGAAADKEKEEAEKDAGEQEAAAIAAAVGAAARAAAALPVGMAVVVQRLAGAESSKYNGCRGVVVSPLAEDNGRQARPRAPATHPHPPPPTHRHPPTAKNVFR